MQYLDDVNYKLRIARLKPIPGDIVYAREGVYGDAVILPSGFDFCLGQRTMLMRMALPEIINYIHKAIISPFVYGQAKALNREGTTSVGHVNMSDIVTFLIPLPPLSEQRRIVAKIEELMPLIDEYDKAQKELDALNSAMPEQLKQSLLQEAIMGKLDTNNPDDEPASELLKRIREEKAQLIKEKKTKKEKPLPEITEDEKPFEIPENWEWVRLQTISTKIVDGDHNPPKGELNKTEFLMVSSQNVNNDSIVNLDKVRYLSEEVFDKENQRTNLQNGDILFTSVGTLGRSCIFEGGLNLAFQRSVSIITTLAYNRYIKRVLDSPLVQTIVSNESTGTAQKGFYINQLENLLIPLPPLSEQRRIVEKLDALLPMISELAKSK